MSFISPFTNVLRTNYIPTPIEIDVIKRTLETPSAEIVALEAQLLQLQEQLDARRARREHLSRSIDEHEKLLTPFRYLPDDILGEIFMACLPTKHEAIMKHSEPPSLLCNVCRRWRFVASRTPRLWATLHIAIPRLPEYLHLAPEPTRHHLTQVFCRNVNRHLTWITIWLNRSRACPLAISIHNPASYSSTFPPDFAARPYYNLVFKVSNRIRRLDLGLSQEWISDLFANVPSTSFPHLRVLLLNFNKNSLAQKWKNSRLLNVPNLTCLSMSMAPFPFEQMTANWSHLTHIVVAGSGEDIPKVNILDAQKIFTCCPRLCFCNINIECYLYELKTYTQISLPYLHTLIIIDSSYCLADLFDYVDIPSLQFLSYHSKLCPSSEWCSALLAILAGTNERVEHLTTNIQFITMVDLVECFNLTPSLTHLTNVHCTTGYASSQRRYRRSLPVAPKMLSALLDLLTPTPNRPLYLPKLQAVDFNLKGLHMKISDREILNFIRRRMDSASHTSQVQATALTKVSFVLTREMEIDVHAQLSDYVANGMKLCLTYLGRPRPHYFWRGFLKRSFGRHAREVPEAIYL